MEHSKNRGWVKNAAIIFLTILLILTFFSNTIMNRSLPEVAVKQVESGSIVAKVRGTGKVEASGFYEVTADASHEILTVMVKSGDKVNVGDLLFVLGEGASDEILKLTEEIRQLELNYQRSAMSMPVFDYSVQTREIENCKVQLESAAEELKIAKERYDEFLKANPGISEKQETARKRIDNTENALNEAMDVYYANYSRFTYLEERLPALEAALAQLSSKADAISANITQLENEISGIQKRISEIEAIAEWQSDENLAAEHNQLTSQLTGKNSTLESLNLALKNTQDSYSVNKEEYDSKYTEYYGTKEENYKDGLHYICVQRIDDLREALELYQSEYNEILSRGGPQAKALAEAQQKYDEIDFKLYTLQQNLRQQQIVDGRSSGAASLELQDIQYQIDAKKQELAKMTGEFDNQITAKVSGVVRDIKVTAGNKISKGDILCTVEVPDMGYTLSFTATRDQVSRVHIGDSATISNYYWGSQIVATLVSIENDPKNPQQGRILTFNLTGDVSAGTELTVSVGQKSATYDTVIPNTALRADSNGQYVYVVTSKNSSLGNRYFATRVAVTVLASDDVNSAVTGEINAGDYIITTSASPVANGQQVRMAD